MVHTVSVRLKMAEIWFKSIGDCQRHTNYIFMDIDIYCFVLALRYHNERMINYDKHRLVMVTKDRTGSTLTIKNASSETDSGNYTCSPDKVRPASVMVHVLRKGNSAAAVQNNERSSSSVR